jgi:hypothetical protein
MSKSIFRFLLVLIFSSVLAAITKPSLRRVSFLGGLYDEKVDEFMGMSLFRFPLNSTTTNNQIQTEKTPYTGTRVEKAYNFADRSRHVGLTTEDSISVLSGMTHVHLSGHYLQDHGETRNSVAGTVIQNIKTEKRFIVFPHDDLIAAVSIDSLKSRATHVIVGKVDFHYSSSHKIKVAIQGILHYEIWTIFLSHIFKSFLSYLSIHLVESNICANKKELGTNQ